MSNSVNKKKKLWQDLTRANWFGEYHSFPQNAEWKGPNYRSIGEVCSPSSDAFSSKRRGRDEQRLSGEKRCAADRGQEERDGIREWAGAETRKVLVVSDNVGDVLKNLTVVLLAYMHSQATYAVDFYISDFQSGQRALVRKGYGTRVTSYVDESVVTDINPDNKDMS
ncbi:hypothetical protein OsI_28322 [Oryza sativa Indica Group]|uniref:Uncharacterized protein n=1 Tax=Oryza sativa subsp. indica TaxID=39946 RepID=A2YSM5_ORYSI|nr:hypothetical protein OsI_28322 [Oryza sativa Indica Group]